MDRDRIGDYAVLGEAGRGGMGIVYHARDESLDRDVAIKVLPDALTESPIRMTRFEREAKLLASLNHPNIASIYGFGKDGDHPFLVMEFVDGPLLTNLIAKKRMTWQDTVPIAIQIANAVEYAHQHDIIHRDLKPANIKFDLKGNAKVLDFGLAKALGDKSSSLGEEDTAITERDTLISELNSNSGATMPGTMLGTAGYLSPEQARGHDVDKQSDIFSFGCLLFEMLTGTAPFDSDSAIDVIGMTLHKDPKWDQLPASLPPRLIKLLQRCLAKNKSDRLHHIGDARIELEELRDHGEEVVTSTTGRRYNASFEISAAAVIATIAALVFASLYFLNRTDQTAAAPGDHAPLNNRAIAIPEKLILGTFSSSKDDAYINLVCSKEVNADRKGGPPTLEWRLYVRPRDSAELSEVHHFTGLAGFAFSPDSESYALNYGGRVFRGRIDSTADPIELARIPDPKNAVGGFNMFPAKRGVIWFDDNTIIIETRDDQDEMQLVLVDARTGDVMKTIPVKPYSNEIRLDGLIGRFDDGHILAYVSLYNDEGFSINIATISLTTGKLEVLVERSGYAQAVDERLFFSRGDSLYVAPYNPETHELLDAGQPLMEGLFSVFGSHSNFKITDSGTLVYKPGGMQRGNRRLMVNTGEGIKPSGLPDAPYDNALSVSGDGSRICVTRFRKDGMWEIWGGTFNPPRMRKILAENDADYCFPMLSYDGTTLGCVQITTTPNGVVLAYVVAPVDGSRPKNVVLNFSGANEINIHCFSPGNTRLLADMADPNGVNDQRHLVQIDIETGEITEFLSRIGGASDGLWSPDGTLISFKTMETGVPELHVYNPKNGRIQPVSHIPVGTQRWIEHPDDSLSLIYWDDEWKPWESTIELDANGGFLIGEPMPYSHTDSKTALYTTLDNRGTRYSIEPGINDGAPNHLVVIENWLSDVLQNRK